jgi:hypothetical protein
MTLIGRRPPSLPPIFVLNYRSLTLLFRGKTHHNPKQTTLFDPVEKKVGREMIDLFPEEIEENRFNCQGILDSYR